MPKPVTIRSTLLGAFVLVALVPAILLAGLAFVKARAALQSEIEHSLASQAGAIAADLDKLLFERLQNAAIWSQLEVMQDLQVQDVDRRLSNFLARTRDGYGGVYRDLSATSPAGRIVASSDPAALGKPAETAAVWQRVRLGRAMLDLSLPEPEGTGGVGALLIRSAITSRFDDTQLGELRLSFDWGQVNDILDRAASGGRVVVVVDAADRIVAASHSLRTESRRQQADTLKQAPRTSGSYILDGMPLEVSTVAVGVGTAARFAGFEGLGWRILMMEPLDLALAPIHRMMVVSLMLLGALVIATLLMAIWVSGAIARPIVALTEFTRRYRQDGKLNAPPSGGAGEVKELATAFVEMVEHIDASQRSLVRASKLAVVGEMSSVIAHEVRTPLGIIRSSAQMLQREPGLSPEGREMTGFIASETERLNRLVSTMLDSSRPRAPVFVPTDVHELIHRCLGLLSGQAAKKRIEFCEKLEASGPVIDIDAEQMSQVLLNLIMNALQVLHKGGRVRASTADHGDRLEIEIADDGPGVPLEERDRVFEAFFFRREGGVGLGLAIVQQIVLAHQGNIVVSESDLGGAAFRIRLPRHVVSEKP